MFGINVILNVAKTILLAEKQIIVFGINVILNVAKTKNAALYAMQEFGINVILNVAKTSMLSCILSLLVWYQCYS